MTWAARIYAWVRAWKIEVKFLELLDVGLMLIVL
jgi:hypothetical protein